MFILEKVMVVGVESEKDSELGGGVLEMGGDGWWWLETAGGGGK